MNQTQTILIVGGVAGGASTAARARRLCENCRIILFDRGPFVSFANCGLPYYVGEVIADESKLIVASPDLFKDRFNIEVRTESEVTRIDREGHRIEVRDLHTGRTYWEDYTKLVLSPGARAIVPTVPGIDLPGIFVLRTIPDSRRIRKWIEDRGAKRAVIVGGGFIGLEMAENLKKRNLDVTVLDLAPQVMPPLDPELAAAVQGHLEASGIECRLGEGLAGFEEGPDGTLEVLSDSEGRLRADIVILSIGVRPEVSLARDCGLEIGDWGGIRVTDSMRTNDSDIFAVGDAVETTDVVTGRSILVPLAGPANRQGRIAADNLFGLKSRFRGVQGTSVCGIFGLVIATTGLSSKALRKAGIEDFESVYLHPGHHVGYYPGARPIHIKLNFRKPDGKILGAQAVGEKGTERRIDVIAQTLQLGGTVFDLEEAELCYAPQFGAAKDPVNLAGMIAANALRGDHPLAHWNDLDAEAVFVLDVRNPEEFERGHVEGATNIPLNDLRARLGEIPLDREVWVYCAVGQRAYYATRALLQHGVRVRNLTGGFATFEAFRKAGMLEDRKSLQA